MSVLFSLDKSPQIVSLKPSSKWQIFQISKLVCTLDEFKIDQPNPNRKMTGSKEICFFSVFNNIFVHNVVQNKFDHCNTLDVEPMDTLYHTRVFQNWNVRSQYTFYCVCSNRLWFFWYRSTGCLKKYEKPESLQSLFKNFVWGQRSLELLTYSNMAWPSKGWLFLLQPPKN